MMKPTTPGDSEWTEYTQDGVPGRDVSGGKGEEADSGIPVQLGGRALELLVRSEQLLGDATVTRARAATAVGSQRRGMLPTVSEAGARRPGTALDSGGGSSLEPLGPPRALSPVRQPAASPDRAIGARTVASGLPPAIPMARAQTSGGARPKRGESAHNKQVCRQGRLIVSWRTACDRV